jgi:hypothetical protein
MASLGGPIQLPASTKPDPAHRVAFFLVNGWLPSRCDVPACVRPMHLGPGNARSESHSKMKAMTIVGTPSTRAPVRRPRRVFYRPLVVRWLLLLDSRYMYNSLPNAYTVSGSFRLDVLVTPDPPKDRTCPQPLGGAGGPSREIADISFPGAGHLRPSHC